MECQILIKHQRQMTYPSDPQEVIEDNNEGEMNNDLTPQDAFYLMAEKNAKLEELLTEFNLELI